MPIHTETLPIPPNTPITNPVERTWKVSPGVIHQVDVVFPSGCAGLVGASICHGAMPVFPSRAGEWFVADGEPIKFLEHYDMMEQGQFYTLMLRGYNTDDTYTHTLYFRIAVLPSSQLPGGLASDGLWTRLAGLFTRGGGQFGK